MICSSLTRSGTLHLLRCLLLTVVSLTSWACDRGRVEADVVCRATQVGMGCEVSRISGTADATACWDVTLRCADSSSSTAHACNPVPQHEAGASLRGITWEEFPRFAECGIPSAISVENVIIDVKR